MKTKNYLIGLLYLIVISCGQPQQIDSETNQEIELLTKLTDSNSLMEVLMTIPDTILVTPDRNKNEFQLDLSKIKVDTKQCLKLNGEWIAEIGGLHFLKTTLDIGSKVIFMDEIQVAGTGWGTIKYNRVAKFYFTESSDYRYEYYVDDDNSLNLIQYDYRNDDLSFKIKPDAIEQKIELNWLDNDNIELILDGAKFKLKRV
jgi:hypothetical protein